MRATFRLAAIAGLIASAAIGGAQAAYAAVIAANAMTNVINPHDRAKLAGMAFSDDQIEIPAPQDQYLMTVRAYAAGKDGGDESTASITLYVDGGRVAHRADSRFNTYNLDATYRLLTKSGMKTKVRFEHINDRALETSYGLEIVDIQRF